MKTFRVLIIVLILALSFLAFALGYFLSGKMDNGLPIVVNEATSTIAIDGGDFLVLNDAVGDEGRAPVVEEANEDVLRKNEEPMLVDGGVVEVAVAQPETATILPAGTYLFSGSLGQVRMIVKSSQSVGFDDGCNTGFGTLVYLDGVWRVVSYGHTRKQCEGAKGIVALIDNEAEIVTLDGGALNLNIQSGTLNYVR